VTFITLLAGGLFSLLLLVGWWAGLSRARWFERLAIAAWLVRDCQPWVRLATLATVREGEGETIPVTAADWPGFRGPLRDGAVHGVGPLGDWMKTPARELGRFPALDGKTWNHPTIARGRLLIRNAEEMVCYELPPGGPAWALSCPGTSGGLEQRKLMAAGFLITESPCLESSLSLVWCRP